MKPVLISFLSLSVVLFGCRDRLQTGDSSDTAFVLETIKDAQTSYDENRLEEALVLYNTAIDHSGSIQDGAQISQLLYDFGVVCMRLGAYEQIHERFKSLDWLENEAIGDSAKTRLINLQGVSYLNLDQYEAASLQFLKGLEIARRSKKSFNYYYLLNNLGLVNKQIGHHDRAIDNYEETIRMCRQYGHSKGLAAALSNIGEIHYRKNQDELALNYFRQALDLQKDLGDLREELVSRVNIANIETRRGNFDIAVKENKKLIQLNLKIKEAFAKDVILRNIGNNYLELGNTDSAKVYLQKVLESSIASPNTIELALDDLRIAYEMERRYDSAYVFLKRNSELKDSLFSIEKFQAVNDLQIQFDLQEKENELLQESVKNKNLLILVLTSFIAIVMLLFAFFKSKKVIVGLTHALKAEARKSKRIFTKNKNELDETLEQIIQLSQKESENRGKLKRATAKFYRLFDACYPGFATNLQHAFPHWTITVKQLKLCKLYAVNCFDPEVIVSTHITASKESLGQLKLLIRRNLQAPSDHEIFEALELQLHSPSGLPVFTADAHQN